MSAEITSDTKSAQAVTMQLVHNHMFPNTMVEDIARRIRKWVPALQHQHAQLTNAIQFTIDVLFSMKNQYLVFAVLRTWLNAWSTTYRKYNITESCRYGCPGPDRLSHYLNCDVLHKLLADINPMQRANYTLQVGTHVPKDIIAEHFLALSFDEPKDSKYIRDDIIRLATACEAYHNTEEVNAEAACAYVRVACNRVRTIIHPLDYSSKYSGHSSQEDDMARTLLAHVAL